MFSYGKNLAKAAHAATACSHRRKPMVKLIYKYSREYGDSSSAKLENSTAKYKTNSLTAKSTTVFIFK